MGRAPCCDKANVKKGPWSPEEDAKLKDFIHKFGTGGNWIALPQKAGLRRCGKSCRLRWLNYLRPNIKHGEFSDEEDKLICTLYATIGSRWSIIAGQLPGRTDNDIKNYWNTKLKKKLMGMITTPSAPANAKLYYSLSSSNTFHQTNSLSTLSQLYYQSLISSAPLVCNNLQNFALSSTTSQLLQDHDQGLIEDSSQYNPTNYYNNNSMLMFGSSGGGYNESCSNSSDGSSCWGGAGKEYQVIKRESCTDHNFQGFNNININGGFDEESQKFMQLHYGKSGDPSSSSSVLMSNGVIMESSDLEQIKQVISIGNGSNLMMLNDHDENKMYYY